VWVLFDVLLGFLGVIFVVLWVFWRFGVGCVVCLVVFGVLFPWFLLWFFHFSVVISLGFGSKRFTRFFVQTRFGVNVQTCIFKTSYGLFSHKKPFIHKNTAKAVYSPLTASLTVL